MRRTVLQSAILDYCAEYEIEITAADVAATLDSLQSEIEFWEEYNARCGIYSIDVKAFLDFYFDDF